MILADKIIMLRKKNGWSQEELANRLHISRQSVSKWEGAQSVPDLDKILQMSKLFGVSTDYLLKDELEEAEYTQTDDDFAELRRVSMEEANEFLRVKSVTAKRIAFAVYLCILSPICLMILGAAAETRAFEISEALAGGIGLIVMLILAACAVAIFISCGSQTEAFEYLEKEVFETEYGVSGMVKDRQARCKEKYTKYNIIAACLCILSLIPLFAAPFLTQSDMLLIAMLCVMMMTAGVGVVLFIIAGINQASLQKLLQEGEYSRKLKSSPLAATVGKIYWLVVVAAFLLYSFYTDDWQHSWIFWPVAAVLYAAIATAMRTFNERN